MAGALRQQAPLTRQRCLAELAGGGEEGPSLAGHGDPRERPGEIVERRDEPGVAKHARERGTKRGRCRDTVEEPAGSRHRRRRFARRGRLAHALDQQRAAAILARRVERRTRLRVRARDRRTAEPPEGGGDRHLEPGLDRELGRDRRNAATGMRRRRHEAARGDELGARRRCQLGRGLGRAVARDALAPGAFGRRLSLVQLAPAGIEQGVELLAPALCRIAVGSQARQGLALLGGEPLLDARELGLERADALLLRRPGAHVLIGREDPALALEAVRSARRAPGERLGALEPDPDAVGCRTRRKGAARQRLARSRVRREVLLGLLAALRHRGEAGLDLVPRRARLRRLRLGGGEVARRTTA